MVYFMALFVHRLKPEQYFKKGDVIAAATDKILFLGYYKNKN